MSDNDNGDDSDGGDAGHLHNGRRITILDMTRNQVPGKAPKLLVGAQIRPPNPHETLLDLFTFPTVGLQPFELRHAGQFWPYA